MIHGPELADDRRLVCLRHDRLFTDLQSTRAGAIKPARYQVFPVIVVAQQMMDGWFLIDGLAVVTDHFNIAGIELGFTHQGARRFGIDGTGQIIEPVEIEQGCVSNVVEILWQRSPSMLLWA